MRVTQNLVSKLAVLALIGLALTACSGITIGGNPTGPVTGPGSGAQVAPTSTPIPTQPVAARPLYRVQRGDVQNIYTFTGRWNPRDQVTLAFPINGTIRRVNVKAGDAVTAGQLLADLQIDNLEQQLATAQLNVETQQANLANSSTSNVGSVSDAEVALANANLGLANAQASSPWTQVSTASNNVTSAQQNLDAAQRTYDDAISRPNNSATAIDQAYSSLKSAQVNLKNAQISYQQAAQTFNNQKFTVQQQQNAVTQARINLQKAQSGSLNPSAQQALKSAQLSVDQLKLQIAQASLSAPLAGTVLEVDIKPGDAIKAYDVTTGIIIGRPLPKEAIASIALTDAQKMSAGLVGVCQVTSRPDTAVQCVVRRIPVSAKDADQTTRVAASLADLNLRDGQLIDIMMPIQISKNVLWLPPAAVRTFQNRTFVVVQLPDGEKSVDVTLGLVTTDRDEIKTGLNEGDVVIGP